VSLQSVGNYWSHYVVCGSCILVLNAHNHIPGYKLSGGVCSCKVLVTTGHTTWCAETVCWFEMLITTYQATRCVPTNVLKFSTFHDSKF
jgi:hypothetical protein